MKRFLLFYGDVYYPNGGMDDFKGSYDTLEEAMKEKDSNYNYKVNYKVHGWVHIWDTEINDFVLYENY